MNKIIILISVLVLSACSDEDKGSTPGTYSSCKITSSEALKAHDRVKDLKQCWNAEGKGYKSKGDAMQWCERTVNNYIANNYLFGHTVAYAIESTNCP